MSDDKSNTGGRDRSRIAMGEEYEVQYWTNVLGVTRDQLQRAVDEVGNSAEKVRERLQLSPTK